MLEPGTIVALCVSLLQQTVKFIDNCHALHTKLNSANRHLGNLINLVSTIRGAVREVHQWAQEGLSWLESDTITGLKAALRTCSNELHVLEAIISKIKPATGVQTLGFRGKVSLVWNEDAINISRATLSAQMQALALLLQIIRIRHAPQSSVSGSAQPMFANPTNVRLFQQWSERRQEADVARILERRAIEAGHRLQQRGSQYSLAGVQQGGADISGATEGDRRSWEAMFEAERAQRRPSSTASTLCEEPRGSVSQNQWENLFK